MHRKKIIGFVLILVFLIPVMPVWQVGLLLGTNGLTEEVAHTFANDGPVKLSEKEIHFYNVNISKLESSFNAGKKWEMDEKFISRQADDIQTPPPNM
jgi:hypothetical protein